MQLGAALDSVSSEPQPEFFSQFAPDLPIEWIEQALNATGTATVRRRRLPDEQVVWLVIGMALMRDRPITEVVNKLDLAMRGAKGPTVAPSAIVQARERLGQTPMTWLFARTSEAPAACVRVVAASAGRWLVPASSGIRGQETACETETTRRADSHRSESGVVLGHHVSALTDTRPVLLSLFVPRRLEPENRQLARVRSGGQ